MILKRTLPPTAAPLGWKDLWNGVRGGFSGKRIKREVEESFKEYLGVPHLFFVSSGKAALVLILRALKETAPARRKVILPAYTCYSVPAAVLKAGLTPVVCDIRLPDLDLDPRALSELSDEGTLCVVPGHLFGIPHDLDGVIRIARERGIYVVEDAAQALGVEHRGLKAGTLGDVGFFSLGRGKNITCGSGGMIVTRSDRIAKLIRHVYAQLPSPGLHEETMEILKLFSLVLLMRPSLYGLPASLPFLGLGETVFETEFPVKRIRGFKMGVLKHWRKNLDRAAEHRRSNSLYYQGCLHSIPGDRPDHPYLRFPVLLKNGRDKQKVCRQADWMGLGISPLYPAAIAEIPELKGCLADPVVPVAKAVAERLVTLPTHHFLTEKDRRSVCGLLEALSPREAPRFDAGVDTPELAEVCEG